MADNKTKSSSAFQFNQSRVEVYFGASIKNLEEISGSSNIILVTDEHLAKLHQGVFTRYPTIVLPAGEKHKQQPAVDKIIARLLQLGADKNTLLVGIGGGVVTDITGYAASIYKRGMKLGLVPTSILAMVDAAIGGKNGVDAGMYKNMIGTIYQPGFILFDYNFLDTLPHEEWVNGFAEIIKHGSIRDEEMFKELEAHSLAAYRADKDIMGRLIENNARLKLEIVTADELETGARKMLNFGHTLGHAIENTYDLKHGHAISIGMMAAARLSERLTGFPEVESERLALLLQNYQLPISIQFDLDNAAAMLAADKKVNGNSIDFILLEKIGKAVVHPLLLTDLNAKLKELFS